MPILNRDYYGASQRGQEDAINQYRARQANALGDIGLEQAKRVNALAQDPNATPDQWAGAGRADVANYMVGRQNAASEQQKQMATTLYQAAQYGLQSSNPKEFIRQNYPQLAQMNPNFDTETDDQIRAGLKEALGVFGPMAGIGPMQAKGSGPLYKIKDPDTGEIRYATAEEAAGETPYIYTPPKAGPKLPPPPRNFRYKQDGSGGVEPIPGGPADPSVPNRPTAAPRPPTEGDKRARVMYRSMQNAEKQIEAVTGADSSNVGQAILGKISGGKIAQSDEYKRYEAAGLRWAANLLYLKSGATATDAEIRSTWLQFFPQIGDGKAVKDQKNEARKQEIEAVNEAFQFERTAAPPPAPDDLSNLSNEDLLRQLNAG